MSLLPLMNMPTLYTGYETQMRFSISIYKSTQKTVQCYTDVNYFFHIISDLLKC